MKPFGIYGRKAGVYTVGAATRFGLYLYRKRRNS
jgi:hypothetical protein